jgi:hypothetical protein
VSVCLCTHTRRGWARLRPPLANQTANPKPETLALSLLSGGAVACLLSLLRVLALLRTRARAHTHTHCLFFSISLSHKYTSSMCVCVYVCVERAVNTYIRIQLFIPPHPPPSHACQVPGHRAAAGFTGAVVAGTGEDDTGPGTQIRLRAWPQGVVWRAC